MLKLQYERLISLLFLLALPKHHTVHNEHNATEHTSEQHTGIKTDPIQFERLTPGT